MGVIAKTDNELVEASLRGEHEAFGHLVARYQDVVCAVSYSSTGDQVLSEDVAQDTFIAAWRTLDQLRNRQRLRPWLCGIARNLARSARKRRRREELVDADDRIASGPSPFDTVARDDVERIVSDALARIPDTYRETLVLYYREDHSIRAVAETLGVSETTVMQRLSRGRRYLADSVTSLVERSLRGERRQRDLVAAVLSAIAVLALPSRVDASPTKAKGSTMLKSVVAASALVAAGTTVYFIHHAGSDDEPAAAAAAAKPPITPALRYGSNTHGLAHAPSFGPTSAPRNLRSRSVAASDLALLPGDAEAVIGVNFAEVRQSALWKQFVEPRLSDASGFREFEALCGFDPLTSLSSISIGLKGMGERDDASGVVVIHGFDKTKSMSCFDAKGVQEAEQNGAHVSIEDGVVLIASPDQTSHVAFTFLDASTALVVFGPEARTREGVERIAAGNDGVQTSTKFADSLQAINTDDSVWLMIAEGSTLVGEINDAIAKFSPVKTHSLYMSLRLTDTLAIDAGARLDSPQTVATVVSAAQAQLDARAPQIKQFFDQLDVIADGSDVIVSVAVSGDQLLALGMQIASSVQVSASP
ncbi:MAG TPA: RNA polymerase sigma factor [Kofleriaceae bacterium]|nr:RNA polymerase sigma factor [Kofleriaceae bacterium]